MSGFATRWGHWAGAERPTGKAAFVPDSCNAPLIAEIVSPDEDLNDQPLR